MRRQLVLFVLASSTLALRVPQTTLSRADLVRAAVGAAAVAINPQRSLAILDDDDEDDFNQNDEIPDVRTGRPKAKRADAEPLPKVKDAAAGKLAFYEIVSARKMLDGLSTSLSKGDSSSVAKELSAAPFSTLEANLQILVQSPLLDADGKKQIGTIKRYGSGADVLIMVGGLTAAVANGSTDDKGYLLKATNALDDVLLTCKGSGLKP